MSLTLTCDKYFVSCLFDLFILLLKHYATRNPLLLPRLLMIVEKIKNINYERVSLLSILLEFELEHYDLQSCKNNTFQRTATVNEELEVSQCSSPFCKIRLNHSLVFLGNSKYYIKSKCDFRDQKSCFSTSWHSFFPAFLQQDPCKLLLLNCSFLESFPN